MLANQQAISVDWLAVRNLSFVQRGDWRWRKAFGGRTDRNIRKATRVNLRRCLEQLSAESTVLSCLPLTLAMAVFIHYYVCKHVIVLWDLLGPHTQHAQHALGWANIWDVCPNIMCILDDDRFARTRRGNNRHAKWAILDVNSNAVGVSILIEISGNCQAKIYLCHQGYNNHILICRPPSCRCPLVCCCSWLIDRTEMKPTVCLAGWVFIIARLAWKWNNRVFY